LEHDTQHRRIAPKRRLHVSPNLRYGASPARLMRASRPRRSADRVDSASDHPRPCAHRPLAAAPQSSVRSTLRLKR
jgi:hypothetical protein